MRWLSALVAYLATGTALGIDIPFEPREIALGENEAQNVVVIDFDGDGDLDVLTGSPAEARVVLHTSDGAEVPMFTATVLVTGLDGLASFDAADLDGDGDIDLATASATSDVVAWHEQAPAPNRGAAPIFVARPLATVNTLTRVRIADLDGDSDPDIIYSAFVEFGWFENDGAMTPAFTQRLITTGALLPRDFQVADYDGDSDADIVVGSSIGTRLQWLVSDGATPPVFSEADITTTLAMPRSIVLADVNNDTFDDLVVASTEDNAVAWFESDGMTPPGYTEHLIEETLSGAFGVVAVDFDFNGLTDIAVTSASDDRLVWFESDGKSPLGFTERAIPGNVNSPREIVIADLDADADPDLVLASAGNDRALYFASEPVRNLTLDALYGSIADVIAEARDGDEILAGPFNFMQEPTIDFAGLLLTLRSSREMTQPGGGLYTLTDGARLETTLDAVFNGEVRVPEDATAEVGGASVSFGQNATLAIESGATLIVDDGVAASSAGILDLLGGSFSASGGLENTGVLRGEGMLFAEVTSSGDLVVTGGMQIAGDVTNSGELILRGGTLVVSGDVISNGSIAGEIPAGEKTSDNTLAVAGDLNLGAASSVRLLETDTLTLAGAFENAITNGAGFTLTSSELRLTGATQVFEASSIDEGATGFGLSTGAGRFPFGTLRLGPGSPAVDLTDALDNNPKDDASEAIYVRSLVIDNGAELRTNGVRVYYSELTLDGTVDEPLNLISLCRADIAESGVVDATDLAVLLASWGDPGADLTGDGVVDATDLAVLLAAWGECP